MTGKLVNLTNSNLTAAETKAAVNQAFRTVATALDNFYDSQDHPNGTNLNIDELYELFDPRMLTYLKPSIKSVTISNYYNKLSSGYTKNVPSSK